MVEAINEYQNDRKEKEKKQRRMQKEIKTKEGRTIKKRFRFEEGGMR